MRERLLAKLRASGWQGELTSVAQWLSLLENGEFEFRVLFACLTTGSFVARGQAGFTTGSSNIRGASTGFGWPRRRAHPIPRCPVRGPAGARGSRIHLYL